MGAVIPLELARRLRAAGVRWDPASGDRFALPDRDLDEAVFVLSDMTVDVHDFPSGKVIGFNGTTEWALDSVDADTAVWLPSEQQLRELLGGAFVRLERGDAGHRVVLAVAGTETAVEAPEPDEAYARALLWLATGELDPAPTAAARPVSPLPGR